MKIWILLMLLLSTVAASGANLNELELFPASHLTHGLNTFCNGPKKIDGDQTPYFYNEHEVDKFCLTLDPDQRISTLTVDDSVTVSVYYNGDLLHSEALKITNHQYLGGESIYDEYPGVGSTHYYHYKFEVNSNLVFKYTQLQRYTH